MQTTLNYIHAVIHVHIQQHTEAHAIIAAYRQCTHAHAVRSVHIQVTIPKDMYSNICTHKRMKLYRPVNTACTDTCTVISENKTHKHML